MIEQIDVEIDFVKSEIVNTTSEINCLKDKLRHLKFTLKVLEMKKDGEQGS